MHHQKSVEEIYSLLETSREGLTKQEAAHRLRKYGHNKLPEAKKTHTLTLFINQFKNPLIYILLAAFIISLLKKDWVDSSVIVAVILISSLMGFFQEYKANRALSRIKQMIKHKARVIRDEKEMIVDQELLVPGDIIFLSPADHVPADARLIETQNFNVIEAALTGESLPSEKHTEILKADILLGDRKNMIFLGTVVAKGKAKAVVVATGNQTQLGHIANLVKETEEEKTPLQKQILHFGKVIGITIIVLNIIIFLLGVIKGQPIFQMFLISVSMIVAAVPEGLLPAMMVILAIGMQRLARHKGLVRKMLAAESLGAITVICSDKTGTLTQGEMRVSDIITENAKVSHDGENFSHTTLYESEASHILALKIGLFCNNAVIENPEDELTKWNIIGDPTEKALLLAGRAAGFKKEQFEKYEPRIAEIPFESEHKYMATLHQSNDGKMIYMKGSPEKILLFSSEVDVEGKNLVLTEKRKQEIKTEYELLSGMGLRVLAVAYRKENLQFDVKDFTRENLNNFIFVGLIALKDPLRREAKETIALCRRAGIRPVIVTGDHRLTTMAIVRDLGIAVTPENVLDGNDIDRLSDAELRKEVEKIIIFARVEPKHKIRIVSALQANGEVVAMTGDGVNDAPALKKSDIGVAVGSGTDVAKETADLVLMDDNFKTIIEAIKSGRGIFDNIRKVVLYLMSNSFNEVILIGGMIILGLPIPLLPAQILWIKMVEDSFPSMALAFDKEDKNVMKRPPRKIDSPILDKNLKRLLVIFTMTSVVAIFFIFLYFWKVSGNIDYSRTIVFVGLGIASRFYIFSVRGGIASILTYNPFQNRLVNISTLFGFLMIAVAIYVPFFNKTLHTVPLGIKEWGVLIGFGLFCTIIYEIGKKLVVLKAK